MACIIGIYYNLSFLTLITDDQETQDISLLPALTFEDVVKYSKDRSGCSNTAKACKFMAEPGYLHDIKGT